jgi:putative acetyltransferase
VRAGQLLHFGTAVETWGTGLAADAHGVLVGHLRATGAAWAWLRVFVDNHRARRFYEKVGWRGTDLISRSPLPPFPALVEYRVDLS